jgi:hypothetical protein
MMRQLDLTIAMDKGTSLQALRQTLYETDSWKDLIK